MDIANRIFSMAVKTKHINYLGLRETAAILFLGSHPNGDITTRRLMKSIDLTFNSQISLGYQPRLGWYQQNPRIWCNLWR